MIILKNVGMQGPNIMEKHNLKSFVEEKHVELLEIVKNTLPFQEARKSMSSDFHAQLTRGNKRK